MRKSGKSERTAVTSASLSNVGMLLWLSQAALTDTPALQYLKDITLRLPSAVHVFVAHAHRQTTEISHSQ